MKALPHLERSVNTNNGREKKTNDDEQIKAKNSHILRLCL